MPSPKNKSFLDRVRALPNFDFGRDIEALVEKHGVTPALLQAVIDKHLVTREVACQMWGDSIGVAYVDPFASVITEEAVEKLPVEIAQKTKSIGLYILNGVMTTAMATPDDEELVERLSQIAQVPISPVLALSREIEDAITIHYCSEKNLEESLAELENTDLFSDTEDIAEKLTAFSESNSLIQLLDEIVFFAMRERATDIHIEAQETQCRIRFRVDGRLREMITYSRKLHRAIITRIKILCNLNIAESRFPQDGRFSMPIGNQSANFRVSTVPSAYGEKSVIRILASTGKRTMVTLDKMMMSKNILDPFKRLIQNPNGIIFVTGPTGSGKTTTLYSALHEINTPDINISTIEDPIEIQLEGVTQSQINKNIDLGFPTILRSLMRQDPDAILIGEIRDAETAKIATEAALTGHIVFATLHTNTAAQAITRLIQIGVEPYMVAPSVIGVVAQRLAARICESCKESYVPNENVLKRYFNEADGLPEVKFYRGRGCSSCRGSGYKGRVAFHELILITEEIRTMISEERSVQDITKAAAKVGFKPLRYDGLKKVLLGLTTIDEIEQKTSIEWET